MGERTTLGVIWILWIIAIILFFSSIYSGVVVSGSMEPEIEGGDIVIADGNEPAEVGDVILFEQGEDTIIHRVIGVTNNGYITQGDANQFPDQGSDEEVVSPRTELTGTVLTYNENTITFPEMGITPWITSLAIAVILFVASFLQYIRTERQNRETPIENPSGEATQPKILSLLNEWLRADFIAIKKHRLATHGILLCSIFLIIWGGAIVGAPDIEETGTAEIQTADNPSTLIETQQGVYTTTIQQTIPETREEIDTKTTRKEITDGGITYTYTYPRTLPRSVLVLLHQISVSLTASVTLYPIFIIGGGVAARYSINHTPN